MIQTFFTKNIGDIFIIILICGWLPLQDPSLAKLILLPVLLFIVMRELPPQYAKPSSIGLLFFWGVFEAAHPYNREIILIWLFSFVAIWLGFRKSEKKLDIIAWGCGLIALSAALLETFGSIHNVSFNLFSTSTSICALLCLLCIPLRGEVMKLRLSYSLISIPTVYLSDSTVGMITFSFALAYLLAPKRHLKLRRLFILIPMIFIIAIIARPKETYINAFEKQFSRWQSNFESWNFLGRGPASVQILNSKQIGDELLVNSQPRLELHPQNDLLFHYHALGAPGFAVRIVLYLIVLNLVLNSAYHFPLLLFLIQTQFTADFLTLPTGILFFFLLGQALGANRKTESKSFSPYHWPLIHSVWCAVLVIQLISCSRYHLKILPPSSTTATIENLKFSNPALQISNIKHLYKMKKWDECLKSIQKHLEIDPFHLYSHLLGADILIQQLKFQEALEWLKNSRMKLPSSGALKQKEDQVSAQLSNS